MSNKLLSWAWTVDLDLADKLVLLNLADRIDRKEYCFPSVSTIMKDTGLSRGQVFKSIKALETKGLITREKQFRKNGSSTSNKYWVNLQDQEVASDDPTRVLSDDPHNPNSTNPNINKKTKQKKKSSTIPKPSDVGEQIWHDFLTVRKAKKLPLTETALNGIRKQAESINWTLEEALEFCCENTWAGFKASWDGVIPKTKSEGQRGAEMMEKYMNGELQ